MPLVFGNEVSYAVVKATAAAAAADSTLTACPRGCGNALKGSGLRGTVKCRCGHAFCSTCLKGAHAPASCAERDGWCAAARAHQTGTISAARAKSATAKPCPNCGTSVARTSGCQYLLCRNAACRHYWCWQCGASSPSSGGVHHLSDCSAPPKAGWLTTANTKFADDSGIADLWFKLAYGRLRSDDERLRAAVKCFSSLTGSGTPAHDAGFIVLAADMVCDARRACAWSIPVLHGIKAEAAHAVYDAQQRNLYERTDTLARQVAAALAGGNAAVMANRAPIEAAVENLRLALKVVIPTSTAAGGAGGA